MRLGCNMKSTSATTTPKHTRGDPLATFGPQSAQPIPMTMTPGTSGYSTYPMQLSVPYLLSDQPQALLQLSPLMDMLPHAVGRLAYQPIPLTPQTISSLGSPRNNADRGWNQPGILYSPITFPPPHQHHNLLQQWPYYHQPHYQPNQHSKRSLLSALPVLPPVATFATKVKPYHKRHKKAKSLPDAHHAGSGGSLGGSKKSHRAEAPSQEDVNFGIAAFTATKFEPHTCTLLENLYASIEVKKYSTAAIDPLRNFLTVYEYPVNKHWVIWDYNTGFVHLTGIWKASLGEPVPADGSSGSTLVPEGTPKLHAKADIVKLLETTPKEYQQHIKRIRGGFLKIQGTWLPYDLCKRVARKFCYHIRYELVPIFGDDFPLSCLAPEDPGFGKLRLDESIGPKHKVRRVRSDPKPIPNVAYQTAADIVTSPICNKHELESNDAHSYAYMLSLTNSRNEVADIISASKCLQSLRGDKRGGYPPQLDRSTTTSPKSNQFMMDASPIRPRPPSGDGPVAANVPNKQVERRMSLKIHDLIT